MTQPTGGFRKRLVRESLYHMIYDSLDALGWFNPGRQHSPIIFDAEPVVAEDVIAINTIGLVDSNDMGTDVELGSNFAEHSWTFYLDFFAERDSLGLHVSGDLQDILEGRINAIGRIDPIFQVFDYNQPTPPFLFTCQIQTVLRDRAVTWSKPHQKHWYSLRFDVLDYYGNETD